MACLKCHNVTGEKFPPHTCDTGGVGPDLAGMGEHHPAEYCAETIIHSNAVIILGEAILALTACRACRNTHDILTITQLIDLVTYLQICGGSLRMVARPCLMGATTTKAPDIPGCLACPRERYGKGGICPNTTLIIRRWMRPSSRSVRSSIG